MPGRPTLPQGLPPGRVLWQKDRFEHFAVTRPKTDFWSWFGPPGGPQNSGFCQFCHFCAGPGFLALFALLHVVGLTYCCLLLVAVWLDEYRLPSDYVEWCSEVA